jgi:ankyrin repeat protein
MNWFIVFLSVFSLFSCELHQQENITQGEKESKEVNLTVISSLSKGIAENDVLHVKKILADGNFELNVFDKDGELLLNKAIRSNSFIIGKLLLDNDADPTAEDQSGKSAIELIKDISFEKDWSALLKRENISVETSTMLIFQAIADANSSNEEIKVQLISGYFELGAPFNGRDSGQFTYLIKAAGQGLLKVVKQLCSYPETDPNISVERGRGSRKKVFTALNQAKDPAVIDALVSCGAKE